MEKSIDIKQSVKLIKECLESLHSKVVSLSAYISTQKMVDSDTINDTMADLLKLSRAQQDCQEEYLTVFPGEKCSELLSEIEQRVEKYEAELAENKLKEEAKYILVKFASIRSDIEDCQKLLDEYTQQLREISADKMALDEYKAAVSPYEEFYNAVETDEIKAKIEYSRKKSIFSDSDRLMINLLQGNIYIDKDNLGEVPEKMADTVMIQTEKNVDLSACVSDKAEEKVVSEPDMISSEIEEPKQEFSAEERKIIDDVKAAGIYVGERTEYGEAKIVCSDNLKKVDSKTFKKDMEKYVGGNGHVIFGFKFFTFLNDKLMKEVPKSGKTVIDFAPMFESMTELGYIMKRTVGDYEPIYDMTTKACECLQSSQNRNWFGSKHSYMRTSTSRWEEMLKRKPEAPDNFLVNDILTEICYALTDELFFCSKAKNKNISTRTTIDEYFFLKKLAIDKINVFISAAFLADEKSMLEYANISDEYINEFTDSIPVAIIMTDTLEECKKHIYFLIKRSPKFEKTSFIGYSMMERSFYCYDRRSEKFDESALDDSYLPEIIVKYSSVEEEIDENDTSIDESAVFELSSDNAEAVSDVLEYESPNDKLSELEENIAVKAEENSSVSVRMPSQNTDVEEINNDMTVTQESTVIEKEADKEESCAPSPKLTDAEIMENVYDMIGNDRAYCASAYLTALSSEKKYAYLRNILAFAMNAPDKKGFYISNIVMSYFDETEYDIGKFADYLRICAGLRTLFYNVSKQDYGYRLMYDAIRYFDAVKNNNDLTDLLFKLKEFKDEHKIGIDAVADYRIKENIEIEKKIKACSIEAQNMYNQYINSPIKETSALPRYIDMKKMIFKKDSALSECLKIVADNNSEEFELSYVKEFINTNFVDDGMDIRSENIRRHSVGEYVDGFWVEAGKSQRDRQKSSKLVSELRHNICGCITKIITVICDWYFYTSTVSSNEILKGYEKEKNIICTSVKNAISSCDAIICKLNDKCDIAGYKCIRAAIYEFKARLDGNYDDNGNKYYYVDFLKYGDVMLNDDFMPDCSGYNVVVNGFMPYERVLAHSKRPDRDFSARIDEIFNGFESKESEDFADDYGCAKLIKEYLDYCGYSWDDDKHNIEINMSDAWSQFSATYDNAIGSLELEQSYGMIDADTKEKILALNLLQYKKAESTHNYGFFRRLLACVENNILTEAKKRESSLNESLNTVISEYSDNQDATVLISEAKEMMKIQNYTVAEDIIHRIQNNDFSYKESVMPEDNLSEFINEHASIYRTVGDAKTNLVMAINRSIKGPRKDVKRGATLIESFPVGKNTSAEKIKTLISYLGFKVKNVTVDTERHSTYDSFEITLQKNLNGKKENFTHPIAPFGSLALENGFRVICLFGSYDTQRLIDKFKEIGTSKHTIVLLDYALALAERRSLARKIKEELSDKIFIVIDRVTIYFLAEHYAENKINRMLMEITMPYSSYQPYSTDSARAIPVEMFMGRKQQLEDIESPKGANIICGGRQLGKSALLRMAKSDINNNENGDRAVYVEIKECDYTKAAKKISETLVDEGILDEGCECDNWNDLSRFIKKRLTNEKLPRIPYLLLLIDEADTFIESCKEVDYSPFDDLEDIQSVGVDRFKFVVAGLRNLVKFEREKATSNNSVLAHLSHKTIRPFTTAEAQELLEKPLHYLGIRFPNEKSKLVPLILANTNYFPGLIHFYCAKLIEVLKKDYAGYNESSTPPYEVNETHIKRVLADPEFNHQIKEKFEITLKLDADNYYHIIAVIMAYCSYNEINGDGYSVDDIYRIAQEYCIEKIRKLSTEKLEVLMDELCELNILRKSAAGSYLFARYNFIQLLGTSEEIENYILMYSEE